MTGKWKTAVALVAAIGLMWLVALWRWQGGSVPHPLRFFALPAGLTLLLPAAWWAVQRLAPARRVVRANARDQGERQAIASAGASGVARDVVAPVERCAVILDGEVCLPAGEGAAQVLGQVARRAVWPQLDDGLRDVEGNPIYTARLPVLDAGEAGSGLGPGPAPLRVFRARAALLRVWTPLVERLSQSVAQVTVAQLTVESAELHPLPLQVVLALPRTWTESQRQNTLALLQQQALHAGEAPLPASLQCTWQLLPTQVLEEPEGLWRWMDEMLASWTAGQACASMLILAADSDLDEEAIGQRQDRGELFTAIHQQGRIPGEGAAALWLATPSWLGAAGLKDRGGVQLHRPVLALRDKSADAAGQVGHDVLRASLDEAMARLPERPVLTVVSDADHRASRTTELFGSLAETVPHLDRDTEVCRLGDACGDLGVVGALAPVAVAAGLLRDQLDHPAQGPVEDEEAPRAALAVCVQSPRRRVVVPVSAARPGARLAA